MNRDVVCQLPPEAGHPPYIAARLKNPAYGMNEASRRWWNILDKALCCYGMVPTRADRCCNVLYSIQSRERTRKQKNTTQWHDTGNISNKSRVRTEVDATCKKMLIPLQEVQPQENRGLKGMCSPLPWLSCIFHEMFWGHASFSVDYG